MSCETTAGKAEEKADRIRPAKEKKMDGKRKDSEKEFSPKETSSGEI